MKKLLLFDDGFDPYSSFYLSCQVVTAERDISICIIVVDSLGLFVNIFHHFQHLSILESHYLSHCLVYLLFVKLSKASP